MYLSKSLRAPKPSINVIIFQKLRLDYAIASKDAKNMPVLDPINKFQNSFHIWKPECLGYSVTLFLRKPNYVLSTNEF